MAMRRLSRLFTKSTKSSVDFDFDHIPDLGSDPAKESDANDGTFLVSPEEDLQKMKKLMLIKQHKLCAAKLENLKGQLASYRTVLQQMSDVYTSGKDQCCCCRYNTLKAMVTAAIQEYDHIHSTTLEERDDETSHLLSPVQRLKDDAAKFYSHEHTLNIQNIFYAEVSENNLRKELELGMLEMNRLTKEHDLEVGRLETLKKGYSLIQNYSMLRRYIVLKHLVEDAIAECL